MHRVPLQGSMRMADPTLTGARAQNTTRSIYFPCSVPGAVPRGNGGSSNCSFSRMASPRDSHESSKFEVSVNARVGHASTQRPHMMQRR